MNRRPRLTISVLTALAGLWPATAFAGANVVATVAPVHSLVAGVMAGVGDPVLLIDGSLSPHGFQLKPSDARALAAADLVVEVGAGLERSLDKPFETLATRARRLTLAEVPGMILLSYRGDHDDDHGDGGPEEHADHDEAEEHDHGGSTTDPHLWLDPRNARTIVAAVAAALAEGDPQNEARYVANAAALDRRLATLDAAIAARLAPLGDVAYAVFHDGYQYLEMRYGLAEAVAVAVNPEIQPGAGHVRAVEAAIAARRVRCLFVEPQFTPKLAETIAAAAKLRTAVLDPLGAGLPPGPELYFQMMERNADALAGCLRAD